MEIRIDEEFSKIAPPLTAEEYAQLESNLIADGCLDALILWDDLLIDGHNRYEICTRLNISFRIEQKEFGSRDDAIIFIVDHQLGRRNLNAFVRTELALKKEAVIARKAKANQGTRTDLLPNSAKGDPIDTRKEIARIADVSGDTVYKVKTILADAPEGLKEQTRRNEVSINEAYRIVRDYDEIEKSQSRNELLNRTLQNLHSSKSNEWYTPLQYVKSARIVLGKIDLDPASSEKANLHIQATNFYTDSDNGLSKQWVGNLWLNPPYGTGEGNISNQAIWSKRLIKEYEAGNVEAAVLLVSANTSEKWFQPLWDYPICFTDHRINFVAGNGQENSGSNHGSALVYFGIETKQFAQEFRKYGRIVIPENEFSRVLS